MATAERAKLQYEAGQTIYAMAALTDSGDHTIFTAAASPMSRKGAFAPVVRVNGLLTGGVITPSAVADKVNVSAGTAYINGALVTWTADTCDITRGAVDPGTAIYCTTSVTITSAAAIADEAGTPNSSVGGRNANGGPPLIPITSIEIGQVWVTATASGLITAGEIRQVPGVSLERSDYPLWDLDYYEGEVTFVEALPTIHTGSKAKGVYASYATPVFADVPISSDFVPPENSYSVSSQQVYQRTLGSTSASLRAGSFTAYLNDGVSDPLLSLEGEMLWFRFYPNTYASPYVACQGTLGVQRTFPAGAQISAACSINAESAAINVS
jgi:hypothetical protein